MISPKEKADEICRKMLFQIEWNAQPSTVKGVARQCALIAVEEILELLPELAFGNRYYDYFLEVKQEIEKL